MMSLYSTRNHRQQFSVSNQKNKKVRESYDNDSFLPDNYPSCSNYTDCLQRKKNNVSILDFQNSKSIGNTRNEISDISLVSVDDVKLSLDDKLPVIMNDLCLNQRNKISFPEKAQESSNNKVSNGKFTGDPKDAHGCSLIEEQDILAEFGMLPVTKLTESKSIPENNKDTESETICSGRSSKESSNRNDEEDRDIVSGGLTFNMENVKRKRSNLLKRSVTNDETMGRKYETVSPLTRCRSIDSTDSFRGCTNEQAYFFSEQGKPTKSKRKLLRRSMSVGFSKFKLITSTLSLKSHHKLRDYDIDVQFKEMDHQTSRRKNTTGSMDQCVLEDLMKIEKAENSSASASASFPPLLRSLSAPDTIDKDDDDDYDEDLSELYLPRRRAICPNLPVPAMKQLKTYLILTRLKQYCFV